MSISTARITFSETNLHLTSNSKRFTSSSLSETMRRLKMSLNISIMFKKLSSVLLSTMLVVVSLTPSTFAQENGTNLRQQQIQNFLNDYQLIEKCLRNRTGQDQQPLTNITASCFILQVFDQNPGTLPQTWRKAKSLQLIDRNASPRDTLTDLEFLSMLFDIAGVGISPLSEQSYQELFREYRLRLRGQEQKTFSTAIEHGIIAAPATQAEAQLLEEDLKKISTIAEAMAYLYQVSISQHDQGGPTITITPFNSTGSSTLQLEGVLKQIIQTIETQSYYNSDFDEKAAMEAAIKALVHSLEEDKYIEYYTEDEYQEFANGLNGNLEGIGAYIEEENGRIIIVSPIKGSPAEKAGIHPNDVITAIDGVDTEGMSVQEAVNRIRGTEGSSVSLTIQRGNQTLTIDIVRAKITVPDLTSENIDGIEVINLVQFGANSSKEMKQALEKIATERPKGILIDLRNNPGGYLDQVVEIVDYFIGPNQPVVYLQDRFAKSALNSDEEAIISGIPIAILINEGSASASEIFAAALQNYGVADIYGETSYGKGTVQNIVTLRDDTQIRESAFKFTSAEYLVGGPNNQSTTIDGIGVIPDSNPNNQDLVDDRQTAVDEALETVLRLMQ